MRTTLRIGILAATGLLIAMVVLSHGWIVAFTTPRLGVSAYQDGVYAHYWAVDWNPRTGFGISRDNAMVRTFFRSRPLFMRDDGAIDVNVSWWLVGMCWTGLAVPGLLWSRRKSVLQRTGGFEVVGVEFGGEQALV